MTRRTPPILHASGEARTNRGVQFRDRRLTRYGVSWQILPPQLRDITNPEPRSKLQHAAPGLLASAANTRCWLSASTDSKRSHAAFDFTTYTLAHPSSASHINFE